MTRLIWLGVLGLPLLASAGGHVGVGVRIGGPGYYYGPPPAYYYPPPYYYEPYYYGPYDYPPPRVVYEERSEPLVQQPPPAYWYWCNSSKTYYPYVKDCAEPWQAVPARPPEPAKLAAAPAGKTAYRFGDVLFAPGSAELQPAANAALAGMLASVQQQPSAHITIEGHTDSTGGAGRNRELSQRRAEAVKQYLVAHGVAAGRISAVGKGEDEPIAGNDTAEGRRQNRRVDVVVG